MTVAICNATKYRLAKDEVGKDLVIKEGKAVQLFSHPKSVYFLCWKQATCKFSKIVYAAF